MLIHVSPAEGKPIYRQIVEQMKYLIASGRLAPEEEILPIRALAEQLLINPNTVARAYRELEMEGLLSKRPGAGTYVSGDGSPLAETQRQKILAERVDALLAEARQLDVDFETLSVLLQERNARMEDAS